MASSSSAKKVARVAARSNANSKNKGANWLFPVVIVVIIAAGIGVLAYARSENLGTGDNDTPPRAQLSEGSAYDHWHAAFAVNVCGKEIGPFADAGPDILGIHAHAGEALIHIHPFSIRAAGENARMQLFFDQVGLEVTDTGFKTPDGNVYKEGETTCGGKPTELVMAHWTDPMGVATAGGDAEPDAIIRSGFGDVPFEADLEAFSLALLPKGEVPALPAGVMSLVNPSDVSPAGAGADASVPDLSVPGSTPGDTVVTDPATETTPGADPAAETPPAPDPATETTMATETTAGSGG